MIFMKTTPNLAARRSGLAPDGSYLVQLYPHLEKDGQVELDELIKPHTNPDEELTFEFFKTAEGTWL